MSDLAWMTLFWGVLVGLGFLEFVFSHSESRPGQIRRWPANVGLGLVNGALASLLPAATVGTAFWAAEHGAGVLNWIAAPAWIAVLVTVVARNLAQYWFHRLAHRIPWLWSVHRVHHCDAHLDATTGLRFHPFEMLANSVFLLPIVVAVGMTPAALAVYESVEVLASLLAHTSLRLPERIERGLRCFVVTPAFHRLHHSDDARQTESNYGAVFTLWDRIFGTQCPEFPRRNEPFACGLKEVGAKQAADFAWLLAMPLRSRGASRSGDAPAAQKRDAPA